MHPAKVGDAVTMELDLDVGTMMLWLNDDQWLGIMASDLSGEYSWAVSLQAKGDCARIEPAIAAAPSPVQLERSSWGVAADALAAGYYAQCGDSDSFTDPSAAGVLDDDPDSQDSRPPPPGSAELSDQMVEQLFRERQRQQRQQRTAKGGQSGQRPPAQQQQQQKQQQLLQRRLQVTAHGRPSIKGVTPQDVQAAQVYARQALRPGW